jgi:1-acyl-sn-glycerol-3-phosphate acyltransferase
VDGDAPGRGRYLIAVNHYHRPGFWAWWLPVAISAVVPLDVHWIITSALTFADRPRRTLYTPVTRRALRRVARLYGFTTMPPMPPSAAEAAGRAQAVRAVLAHVRRPGAALVGLAPEGGDAPGGQLRRPPSGVGRFIHHLGRAGLRLAPAALYEAGGALCLRFGPVEALRPGCGLAPEALDRETADHVMRAIAALLPPALRGVYAG